MRVPASNSGAPLAVVDDTSEDAVALALKLPVERLHGLRQLRMLPRRDRQLLDERMPALFADLPTAGYGFRPSSRGGDRLRSRQTRQLTVFAMGRDPPPEQRGDLLRGIEHWRFDATSSSRCGHRQIVSSMPTRMWSPRSAASVTSDVDAQLRRVFHLPTDRALALLDQ